MHRMQSSLKASNRHSHVLCLSLVGTVKVTQRKLSRFVVSVCCSGDGIDDVGQRHRINHETGFNTCAAVRLQVLKFAEFLSTGAPFSEKLLGLWE